MKNKSKGSKKNWIVFSLLFFLFSPSLHGMETDLHSLRGLARVLIEHNGKKIRFDQAISIQKSKTGYRASFETLDDFGNTWVMEKIEIASNHSSQKLKKWLKLPFTDQEMIKIILADGSQVRKGHTIHFCNFKKHGKFHYPHRLVIQSSKTKETKFEIDWHYVFIQ